MIRWECEDCNCNWNGDETDFECPNCNEINIKGIERITRWECGDCNYLWNGDDSDDQCPLCNGVNIEEKI
ncbi:hypothetical protein AAGG74_15150 [Bacillus mexicanus]|uniref:hypothetical protein n=1 Tax=Bacillus mexicanus TaxID=2834415 RepID=UPI003D1E054B